MIIVLITKRVEIIMSIQVCLISWMNINNKEIVERKAFLANPKHQDYVSQCVEHDCSVDNKKNGDYYKNLSLSHFMNEL